MHLFYRGLALQWRATCLVCAPADRSSFQRRLFYFAIVADLSRDADIILSVNVNNWRSAQFEPKRRFAWPIAIFYLPLLLLDCPHFCATRKSRNKPKRVAPCSLQPEKAINILEWSSPSADTVGCQVTTSHSVSCLKCSGEIDCAAEHAGPFFLSVAFSG
jgi:hypothetical protein